MPDQHGIPCEGDKVRFLNKNGYPIDLSHARTRFVEGQVLTVAHSDVGDWYTWLKFEEVPGDFNSVMFELVEESE